jgi:hypothetical protein
VFAAISVSGPKRRVTWERVPELAELVVSHARQISTRLGWREEPAPPRDDAKAMEELLRSWSSGGTDSH